MSGSFGPDASWNATDVIVASGTPFAWLWMLTVSSNATICLHGSQLGFVTLLTLMAAMQTYRGVGRNRQHP